MTDIVISQRVALFRTIAQQADALAGSYQLLSDDERTVRILDIWAEVAEEVANPFGARSDRLHELLVQQAGETQAWLECLSADMTR